MSLNKEIQYHEYGLNLCRDALKSDDRHAEAVSTVVTVCQDIIKFTGRPAHEVFAAVTQELGHRDCSTHGALLKARSTIGLPVLVNAA